MKSKLIQLHDGAAAVHIKAGETIPEWLFEDLSCVGVQLTNPLSGDLLYPVTVSIVNPDMWDVGADGSYQEFSIGDDPSAFMEN